MLNFRNFIKGDIKDVIILIGGMILSALIKNAFGVSENLLIAAIVVIILIAVYYFSRIFKLIDNRVKTTVLYIEEPYCADNENITYNGDVFKKTSEWLRKAKTEILILSATFGREKPDKVAHHKARQEYFDTIYNIVKDQRFNDFKYVRINQIPPDKKDYSIVDYIGEEAKNHSIKILELKNEIQSTNNNSKAQILVEKIPFVKLTSLWIIDKKYVITEVSGQDSDGRIYPEGRFFFEDHGGDLVKNYLKYFEEIRSKAIPLTIDELRKSKLRVQKGSSIGKEKEPYLKT